MKIVQSTALARDHMSRGGPLKFPMARQGSKWAKANHFAPESRPQAGRPIIPASHPQSARPHDHRAVTHTHLTN